MKQILLAFFPLITTVAAAQTKMISFKSHSGNMENFTVALESDLFNDEASNFGAPSHINTYYLDSVIYLSPSSSIVVRKVYTRRFGTPEDSSRFDRMYRDTIHDPLFAKKHALDSIKNALKTGNGKWYGDYRNAVFVGYDNLKPKEKKIKEIPRVNEKPKENNIIPAVTTGNNSDNNSPLSSQMLQMLSLVLLIAFLGGWLSWKFQQPRLQKA